MRDTDMIDSPGARIGHECGTTFIAADAKLRPLRDQIIIEPLDWAPSTVIVVAGYSGRPLRGVIKAIGPGIYPKRYNAPKGPRRNKSWDSKHFLKTEVRVGDVVELGGLELEGYLHQSFMWGHKLHVICREADVAGIIESSEAEWADDEGRIHGYKCGLNPDPFAAKHLVDFCTCE